MKKFEKRILSSFFLAACMGTVLTIVSCNSCTWFDSELKKTVKTAVADGKISKSEAQKIIKAFEEDGTYTSLEERVDYVTALCDIEEEDIRNALDIVVPPNSKSVFVYLDNTESMRGYIDATDAGKFASVLSAINDFYSKNDDVSVKAFYTEALKQEGEKVTNIVSVDFAQLRSNLIEHTMQKFTDSYQLNDFFNDVTNRLLNDSVNSSICFFITDGIPSGTNEEINPPGRKLKLEERKFNTFRRNKRCLILKVVPWFPCPCRCNLLAAVTVSGSTMRSPSHPSGCMGLRLITMSCCAGEASVPSVPSVSCREPLTNL